MHLFGNELTIPFFAPQRRGVSTAIATHCPKVILGSIFSTAEEELYRFRIATRHKSTDGWYIVNGSTALSWLGSNVGAEIFIYPPIAAIAIGAQDNHALEFIREWNNQSLSGEAEGSKDWHSIAGRLPKILLQQKLTDKKEHIYGVNRAEQILISNSPDSFVSRKFITTRACRFE